MERSSRVPPSHVLSHEEIDDQIEEEYLMEFHGDRSDQTTSVRYHLLLETTEVLCLHELIDRIFSYFDILPSAVAVRNSCL
jgi:hypothetical protein